MKILSLFDGIACARVACDRAGIPVQTYYASEVEKHAIAVARKNWPEIIYLGDVRNVQTMDVDILIGGSPCQDLSSAGKRQGLHGERSRLFWEYVRLRNAINPPYFILENVASMNKENKARITEAMGVEPIMIDAALVSAQSRKRLFWTNIPTTQPADKGIVLSDILEDAVTERGKSYAIDAPYGKGTVKRYFTRHRRQRVWSKRNGHGFIPTSIQPAEKSDTLRSSTNGNYWISYDQKEWRPLTPIEWERLMGLPDGYTEGSPKTHRYKCLGNAFHVDVVAHILRNVQHS